MSPSHRSYPFADEGGYRSLMRVVMIALAAVGAGLIASLLVGA